MGIRSPLVCVDQIQLSDLVDIGQVLPDKGVVPVVVKSLVFADRYPIGIRPVNMSFSLPRAQLSPSARYLTAVPPTIFSSGPAIPIPVPQASSWTLRIAKNARIQTADIVAFSSDVDSLVGGQDSHWWIEADNGQIFSGYGTDRLKAALNSPPFRVVGFEVEKHSHPGFPDAHAAGQPHPQTPTLRFAHVDLRRAREVTIEGDDPTWVAGARGAFSGRVALLPSTWLWRQWTSVLVPLAPAAFFAIAAYALARSTRDVRSGDVVNAIGIGAGLGFVLGGQVLEYLRRRRPATFGAGASSPWLEGQWAVAANFVATLVVLVAAFASFVR